MKCYQVYAVFIFFLSLLILTNLNAQQANKPNILVILTDDQGYHDVSFYGTQDINTPNIDYLRSEGMLFNNFYANSPVCAPTRASLLSGRYPDQVGVPGLIRANPDSNWGYLDSTVILLPKKLKEAGYHTAHIGKWNLGLESPNLPNEKGFDHFQGWLEDMMDDYVAKRRYGKNYMRLNEEVIDPKGHATDLFSQWATDYIYSRENSDNPFFLYLAYNAPHYPVQPPADFLEDVLTRHPKLPEKRAKLVALIEHMDYGIGQVIESLKKNGQYDNTIILFTSDNGGNLPDMANNGSLRDGKQSMYEGGLRVPTVLVWPDIVKKGSSTESINSTMDVYPTMVAAAGLNHEKSLNGRSFLPILQGKEITEDRILYFVRREGGIAYGGNAYHAVRKGKWKLLQNSPYEPLELYNLSVDPYEKHNEIQKFPDKLKELNAILMKHIQEGGKIPWQAAD